MKEVHRDLLLGYIGSLILLGLGMLATMHVPLLGITVAVLSTIPMLVYGYKYAKHKHVQTKRQWSAALAKPYAVGIILYMIGPLLFPVFGIDYVLTIVLAHMITIVYGLAATVVLVVTIAQYK